MKVRNVCAALLGVVVAQGAVTTGMATQAALVARWIDRTPPGKQARSPKGVQDCAMVYDPAGHRMVLFGGRNDAGRSADGLWAFDLAKSVWQEIPTEGARPPGVSYASAIHDPIGHRVIVYGGERELWSFDLKTDRWRNMSGTDVPRRESHSAIYDERGKRMVVFGGSDGGHLDLYEVLALDLDPASPTFEKWQNLTVEAGHPPGRMDHTAVYDAPRNRMVVHAGYIKRERKILQDTWEYAFAEARDQAGRWRQINSSPLAPPARRRAVGVHDDQRHWLIVQGGESDRVVAKKPLFLSDAWALDLTADVWFDITPYLPGPGARVSHQAIYDPDTRNLIFYGGVTEDEHVVPHDVWELRLPTVK